jgi:hypothetical protein
MATAKKKPKDLKSKVESVARYYAKHSAKSDVDFNAVMSAHEIGEYAREKFDENFGDKLAASKYKAHFVTTLRTAYTAAIKKAGGKRGTKTHAPAPVKTEPHVKAETLKQRACRSKHIPAFMKRFC